MTSVTDLDLSKLQPFLDRNWATFGEKLPAEAVAKLQKMVYLRAVFQLHSSSLPHISLHMPEHLAALVGSLSSFIAGHTAKTENYPAWGLSPNAFLQAALIKCTPPLAEQAKGSSIFLPLDTERG